MADPRSLAAELWSLDEPVDMEGRATFLPFKDKLVGYGIKGQPRNQREWAMPGVVASMWNAVTAPRRALDGGVDDSGQSRFNALEEAQNVAGMAMGGGGAASGVVRPVGPALGANMIPRKAPPAAAVPAAEVAAPKQFDTGVRLGEILAEGKAPGIPVASETGPILPRLADPRIPTEQAPIPRLTPTGRVPEYNDRAAALLRSGAAARAVDNLITKGRNINPELSNWYGSEPLRQFALNEGLSPAEFERMMAQLSSASQRSPVLKENLLGSYMWQLDKLGELSGDKRLWTKKLAATEGLSPTDPGVVALPSGMGSLAQTAIFDRAQKLAQGAKPEDVFGEKLLSYYRNKMGNEVPVTIDVNAVKGPVISTRNPDWLKTLHVIKNPQGEVVSRYTPLADYKAGKLTPKEASKQTGFWIDAPENAGEYKAFEELWRRAAKRADVSPAGAQALGWYGSADVTALKTKPKTYMELIEESARAAAARQGITPVEALRRFVRGEKGSQLGANMSPAAGAVGVGTAEEQEKAQRLARSLMGAP